MIAAVREKVASWLVPRAKPISFAPPIETPFFGTGVGGNQPSHETLLAETLGVADICARAIGNRLASLKPLVKVSRRRSNGTLEDEILDDHVLMEIFEDPHPTFTLHQMMRLLGQSIVTVGEGYWLKITNQMRLTYQLQPMPAQNVAPIVTNGEVSAYEVKTGSGDILRLDADEVLRFWFPDPETIYTSEGYLGPNGFNADAYKFATQHLRHTYERDAIPKVLLKAATDAVSPTKDEWERYLEDWSIKHNRREGTRSGVPAKLPQGWDAIMVALQSGADITPLLEYWQQNMLLNYGVPASVLGRVISGDRSSAETNQFVFDKHTIEPIAKMIADTLTTQLARDFDEDLFVEFEKFVSDDKDHTLKREAQDLQLKVKSPQQILADRGDDPEAAPWGELPVGTFSDQPYTGEKGVDPFAQLRPDDPDAFDDSEDEPDEDPDDGEPRGGRRQYSKLAVQHRVVARERKWRPRLERALRSFFEMQRRETIKRAKSQIPRARAMTVFESLFDPNAWTDEYFRMVLPDILIVFESIGKEEMRLLGGFADFAFTPYMKAHLRKSAGDSIRSMNTTTGKKMIADLKVALEESIEEGDPTRAIVKTINEVFKGRKRNAATIARTELQRASIGAQLESYRQADVPGKRWIDQRDQLVRDEHEQSRIAPVPRDQPFIVDGYPADGPGDPALPPHLSINCRCGMAPIFLGEGGFET